MHKSPEPQPLTRLNVTKHDRIWDKEIPKGFFGFDSSNTLFSPPLKHITPETTEELWEKFDPLDLLIDSASEKSVKSESSSDTMIMMTTEELKRNEERIKNSFKEFEHSKKSSQMNPGPLDYDSRDFLVEQSDFQNNNDHKSEEDILNDEGYGTDSRTNTTASLSSPLSSSLSSLLTSESSSSQGSLQRNVNGNSRPPQIAGNGRLVVAHRQNVVAKKKVQPMEKQDNSLMERLRALTTIQEEDAGASCENLANNNVRKSDTRRPSSEHRFVDNSRSLGDQYRNDMNSYGSEVGQYVNDPRYSEPRLDSDHGRFRTEQSSSVKQHVTDSGRSVFDNEPKRPVSDGIFRAIPVKIGHRNSLSQMENIPVNGNGPSEFSIPDSRLWNGDMPRSQSHESKLRPGDHGEITQPKMSKHPSYMYSMPNLLDDGTSRTQPDTVVMRRPKPHNSNFRTTQKPDYRYSWDVSDSYHLPSKFDVDSRNFSNYPMKSVEQPKLSNQFRASSEMALQNGRALFAPSSDIYKLFQGQGRTGFNQGKQASHRHSFHAMPSQSHFSHQPTEPSMEEMRHRLRTATTQHSSSPVQAKNGPVRASHELYLGMAQQNRNHKMRPSSLADAKDKLSTLV